MNLRQIKSKIKSIKNVGQITKAMQLVSAVKMKKAQNKATMGKPYRMALDSTIKSLVSGPSLYEHPLTMSNQAHKKLAVVISSNKGLCGVFNFNLFKFIYREIKDVESYDFVVMGLKAQQFLFNLGGHIIADFSQNTPFESNVTAIYSLIKEEFLKKKYAQVDLISNRFISSLSFQTKRKMLLPLNPSIFAIQLKANSQELTAKNYTVEPTPYVVIDGLFNFYLESEIRGAIQESEASEHSARMIAMKNATDNSKDLVYSMTLLRNSIRQTRITNELLDMNTSRLAVS